MTMVCLNTEVTLFHILLYLHDSLLVIQLKANVGSSISYFKTFFAKILYERAILVLFKKLV